MNISRKTLTNERNCKIGFLILGEVTKKLKDSSIDPEIKVHIFAKKTRVSMP